jgi:hypothetical protein
MVAAIIGIYYQNKSSNTSSDDDSAAVVDTAAVVVDTTAVAVDSAAAIIDTVAAQADPININNTLYSYKDDNDITSEQAVKNFFSALANKDCDAAWNETYNPIWEKKGKEWFCSNEAFGGVHKVLIDEISTISQNSIEAKIYVSYYTEDIYNGNKCYKQNIIVNKISFSHGQTRWQITNMKNTQVPYECLVSE